MTDVKKYNIFKGVSTVLTTGTPIVTLACFGDFFVHRSDTAISAAAVFAILIAALFAKDKMLEALKTPSAFKISLVVLVICLLVENLLIPIEAVCFCTICASLIDEFTFKKWYTNLDEEVFQLMPKSCKKMGFIMCKQTTVDKKIAAVKEAKVVTDGSAN